MIFFFILIIYRYIDIDIIFANKWKLFKNLFMIYMFFHWKKPQLHKQNAITFKYRPCFPSSHKNGS